jgi:hypothetical protein
MSDRKHEHVPTSILANMSGHADREAEHWHQIWRAHKSGLHPAESMLDYWRDEVHLIQVELKLRRELALLSPIAAPAAEEAKTQ